MKECNCGKCSHGICAGKVPIFSFLSEEELVKIVQMTGHRLYRKGEMICHEGEGADTLFIINEGQIKISKITKDGKEQIVHILTSGDFFGELSLFGSGERYNFSVSAISDVKICTLTKKDMDELIMHNPQISIKILQVITSRLAETENLAQNLATNDPEIRIAYMLLEFGAKYGIQSSDGIAIKLPVTREEMANYVGVTRETISRKLSKFEELGMISLKGNKMLIIKDEDSLRDYVE